MPRAKVEAAAYDPSRALFSLHVPKTAGTSFRNDLEAWFGRANMAFHYRGDQGEPARSPAVLADYSVNPHKALHRFHPARNRDDFDEPP